MLSTPASLRALLRNVIDYAGLFPPAALPLEEVAARYESYRTSPDAWMLNRLVLPFNRLFHLRILPGWRISVLAEEFTGPLPPEVESIETKPGHEFDLPTYVEGPLDAVGNAFAKVRTGGLTPDATPSPEDLAGFLHAAAARRLPFKATAGLHHPLRSTAMHGFLNVFLAAAFAWKGVDRATLIAILNETEPSAFEFREDAARWRAYFLPTADLETVRRDFAHSFGSCSFEEPLADLREMGWLP